MLLLQSSVLMPFAIARAPHAPLAPHAPIWGARGAWGRTKQSFVRHQRQSPPPIGGHRRAGGRETGVPVEA